MAHGHILLTRMEWPFPAHLSIKKRPGEFIKWNTLSEESQEKISQLGVPVLKSYVESDNYLNDFPNSYAVKYNKEAFADMMNRAAGQESLEYGLK